MARISLDQPEPKPCIQCHELFYKKDSEGVPKFAKRKYCSRVCAKAYQRDHKQGFYSFGRPHSLTNCNEFRVKEEI